MPDKYSERRKQILEQLHKFSTDAERMAAYAGFALGEWLGLIGDWNVQKRDPTTGELLDVAPPARPEIAWSDENGSSIIS